MKVKTLAAMCKKHRVFCLYDEVMSDTGEVAKQWLGDGAALYPLEGVPYLDNETICTLFDVTRQAKRKNLFQA